MGDGAEPVLRDGAQMLIGLDSEDGRAAEGRAVRMGWHVSGVACRPKSASRHSMLEVDRQEGQAKNRRTFVVEY